MKSAVRDKYREGDVFAVPLRGGGYARGMVVRENKKGTVFGYFWGPRLMHFAELRADVNLTPDTAVLVGRFGDLGLLNGEWRVVGQHPNWNRDAWKMPPFIRVNKQSNLAWLSYLDDRSFRLLKEEPVDPIHASEFPRDAGMGYGAVEIRLSQLLGRVTSGRE